MKPGELVKKPVGLASDRLPDGVPFRLRGRSGRRPGGAMTAPRWRRPTAGFRPAGRVRQADAEVGRTAPLASPAPPPDAEHAGEPEAWLEGFGEGKPRPTSPATRPPNTTPGTPPGCVREPNARKTPDRGSPQPRRPTESKADDRRTEGPSPADGAVPECNAGTRPAGYGGGWAMSWTTGRRKPYIGRGWRTNSDGVRWHPADARGSRSGGLVCPGYGEDARPPEEVGRNALAGIDRIVAGANGRRLDCRSLTA